MILMKFSIKFFLSVPFKMSFLLIQMEPFHCLGRPVRNELKIERARGARQDEHNFRQQKLIIPSQGYQGYQKNRQGGYCTCTTTVTCVGLYRPSSSGTHNI
jgi:hypothetical protein